MSMVFVLQLEYKTKTDIIVLLKYWSFGCSAAGHCYNIQSSQVSIEAPILCAVITHCGCPCQTT